jgi:hypothetical protein
MAEPPSTLEIVLACAGGLAAALAWVLVRRGKVSVWSAMGALFVVLGSLSLATGTVVAAGEVSLPTAVAVGAGSGFALYGATMGFVLLGSRWALLRHHAAALYRQGKGVPLGLAVVLAAGVTAPGEELFWRGLVQVVAAHPTSEVAGAAIALAGYVAANLASGSVPVILAALIGGAVWGGLALGTGGVVASLVCHAIWTGLMVAVPPRAKVSG